MIIHKFLKNYLCKKSQSFTYDFTSCIQDGRMSNNTKMIVMIRNSDQQIKIQNVCVPGAAWAGAWGIWSPLNENGWAGAAVFGAPKLFNIELKSKFKPPAATGGGATEMSSHIFIWRVLSKEHTWSGRRKKWSCHVRQRRDLSRQPWQMDDIRSGKRF